MAKKSTSNINPKHYGTIKSGKVKFRLGSPMHKRLEARNLPYSEVVIKDTKKMVKRHNTK